MGGGNYTGIIRIVPAFLCGMFLAMYYKPDYFLLCTFLSFPLLILLGLKFLIKSQQQYSWRWLTGVCIQVAVLFSAALLTVLKSEISYTNHFSKNNSSDAYMCIINEAPIVKGKNLRFEVQITGVKSGKEWLEVQGRCLVYVRTDSSLAFPEYGDKLLFLKAPQLVAAPMNPEVFDFQAWLRNREIYHQVFLKSGEMFIESHGHGNYFMTKAVEWRSYLMQALRNSGIEGQEDAVLSALILGQDDEIDQELRQRYAAAGVMHILAVSGMHVGLIYAALRALLKFPSRKRKHNWYKAGILILCLWFYAMLTGLSPSVLRASMMLSFLVAGISLGRSISPLNILAASAICLFMVFSPALILSAGFQLSYLAVGGILFLYKPLHSAYTPKTWLGSQVWSITSVSIVAQLATFPLSIFYFHRFPNYFLLSNLLVIPLATLAIFAGIVVLLLSWWRDVAMFLGKILSTMLCFLNESVGTIGQLPGASSEGLYLSKLATGILYVSIIFLALFLLKIRPKHFLHFLLLIIVFFSWHLFENYQSIRQSFWIVFHVPKHTYIQFVQGTSVITLSDSSLNEDAPQRKRISENYILERGIEAENNMSLIGEDGQDKTMGELQIRLPFLKFKGERIYVLQEKNKFLKPASSFIDFIIVSGNPILSVEKWLEGVHVKTVIADAGNSYKTIEHWEKECLKRGIRFVNISKSGAFTVRTE